MEENKKAGRPLEWTPERLEEIRAAFNKYIEEKDIPIVAEFASKHGLRRQTLYEHEALADVLEKCLSKKEAALESLGLTNGINTTMAIFSLKQLGWSDKQQVNLDAKEKITFEINGYEGI